MAKRKAPATAAARTLGLFGEEPKLVTFTAPERLVVGGFAPPPPGQVGLFGPQQMDIGDKERIARTQAFKAAQAAVAQAAAETTPHPFADTPLARRELELIRQENEKAARERGEREEDLARKRQREGFAPDERFRVPKPETARERFERQYGEPLETPPDAPPAEPEQPKVNPAHVREDFSARREARLERLEESAAKTRAEAEGRIEQARARANVIPFGQPIHVGHYSEGADRRFREKIHSGFRKGYEGIKEAETLERRAKAAKTSKAISSDDPNALEALEAKLEGLKSDQRRMVDANKAIRKAKGNKDAAAAALVELGFPEARAQQLLEPDFANRIGFPDYATKNTSAEIRRVEKRLEELKAHRAAPAMEAKTIGDVEISEGENRVKVRFPDKPSGAVRAYLQAHGFRWAPTQDAWIRQISNQAHYHAEQVAKMAQAEGAIAGAEPLTVDEEVALTAVWENTPADPALVKALRARGYVSGNRITPEGEAALEAISIGRDARWKEEREQKQREQEEREQADLQQGRVEEERGDEQHIRDSMTGEVDVFLRSSREAKATSARRILKAIRTYPWLADQIPEDVIDKARRCVESESKRSAELKLIHHGGLNNPGTLGECLLHGVLVVGGTVAAVQLDKRIAARPLGLRPSAYAFGGTVAVAVVAHRYKKPRICRGASALAIGFAAGMVAQGMAGG